MISTGRIASDSFGSTMEELDVDRGFFSKTFRFGPYAVSRVDQEAAHDRDRAGAAVVSIGDSTSFKGSRFTLARADRRLEGRCLSNSVTNEVKIFSWEIKDGKSGELQCSCRGQGAALSMLAIERTGRNPLRGELQIEDRAMQVSAIHHSKEGMRYPEALGFRIDGGAGLIGVVEVSHERVWLARELSDRERDSVACVLAGLLLHHRPTSL